jgi:purine-nucleoside phosphorylase
LRKSFLECGKELNMDLHEGVYGNVGGPTYESPSDSLWCRQAGMDSVGMSTAHEAIVALYCGLKVLAFSIITDMVSCDFDNDEPPNHEEIVKVANAKAKQAETLVSRFLVKIKENPDLLN